MELEPGLRVVTAPNPGFMTGTGTNQYLLGERRLTMIDAALGAGENVARLEAELADAGATIERILLTHIHPDHLGGAEALRERFRVPLGMHVSRSGYAGIEPDFVYADGDRVAYDGGELAVVHTPGHESGHCCFHEARRSWLFTGDHVVGAGTVVIAPPDGDMTAYLVSLHRLLAVEARVLLGGHGPAIRDPRAKIQEYIDHRLERERQVLACVREGLGQPGDIVARLYRDVAPVLHPVAEKSVEAHLAKLASERRIERRGSGFAAV
jgi:glyoxylase-like metal-dependent hydrolase (beta-lactamase superfamily II)